MNHRPSQQQGKEEFEKVDMSAYSKYTFSMYGGKIQNVTMRFQNRMMGVVMDRFGRDVVTTVVDKEHFQITVPVAVSDQFYGWIFGLGNYVTIVGPERVKEGMKKALEKVTKRYE
ncbi:MAG: WYL domain-containing protein [Clostridia bacterium]|nr:WYL domain-containing protein [Clostridia bacterium]